MFVVLLYFFDRVVVRPKSYRKSSNGLHANLGLIAYQGHYVSSGEATARAGSSYTRGKKVRGQFYPKHDLVWLFIGLSKEG